MTGSAIATASEVAFGSTTADVVEHTRHTTVIVGPHTDLLRRLARLLGPTQVTTTEALGVPPDWVEAVAFAWLACRHVEGRAANLPAVTGARGARVLGACWPA